MSENLSAKPLTVPAVMSVAISGISEVCETMFGIRMVLPEKPSLMTTNEMSYGLNISLVRPQGSWELGLFGTEKSCKNLTRALLGMDDEEEPALDETVDLLGEIVNMVSGIVKGKVRGGAELHLGVPLALVDGDCKKYTPRVIPLFGQRLTSEDFEGELFLVWSERERAGLTREAGAWLREEKPDAQQLGSAISLLGEAEEQLGADVNSEFRAFFRGTEEVLMGLLNEEIQPIEEALAWTRRAIADMAAALSDGTAHQFEEVEIPQFGAPLSKSLPQEKVERDSEMLEMLGDFLQESEEGLQLADQVLMAMEGGNQDPDNINKLFRVFHSMKGLSSFLDLNDITGIAHTTETLLAQVRDGKSELVGSALDVVFESTELMRSQLEAVTRAVEQQLAYPSCPGKDELLERLEAVMRGETVIAPKKTTSISPSAANAPAAPKLKETVKIATELVSRLANIADKLTAFDTTFKATSADNVPKLSTELEVLCAEIREVSALMQMISLGTLFSKMTRMVRDLSKKTGKLARLALVGEDTMVPRGINEKLGDPLVHMIRNAVDHGVEATADRKAAGKPPMGSIQLSAEHIESDGKRALLLRLRDDGKGLKRDALLKKAISKGLIEADAELTDEEVFELIFAPGFSTAAAVTAISGRGVGMDVVRRNIQGLGGTIKITSTEGAGSVFHIQVPLVV